jgi:hypothetical protein
MTMFFDSLSINSEIELGPSQNKIFFIIFHQKKKKLEQKQTKWRTKSRWPPIINFYANQLKLGIWKERYIKNIA